MENINIDRIGNDLADAYEEGYKQGIKKNEENNKKLRNLQKAIIKASEEVKEKVIVFDIESFKDVYGKEIKLRFSNKALESMKKELED